jgi:hypothetical protein
MVTSTQRPPRYVVSLKLPRAKAPELVVIATAIVKAMTGNTWFPSPTPTLATVKTAIGKLSTAQAAALSRALGLATARDDERAVLVKLLQQLKAYVQNIADANPETAVSIIESAGMSVKKHPVFAPREFAAKQGPTSGTVKLVAPRAAQRAGYEWGLSTDGGKTWPSLPFTLQAKTLVTGLVPGQAVMFRYRPTTKGGGGDWSQVISFIVR